MMLQAVFMFNSYMLIVLQWICWAYLIDFQVKHAELPVDMLRKIINKNEKKILKAYLLSLSALLLTLVISQCIGIRPSICTAWYAWIANMLICVIIIFAVTISFFVLQNRLKKHFHLQYQAHKRKNWGLFIGMILMLTIYFVLFFTLVFKQVKGNDVLEMFVN